MSTSSKVAVLSIAGTDPSGGAGIQADLKAISATGGYAASVITVLVAQNSQRVQSLLEIPPSFIEQQLELVFADLQLGAIKIGMLYSEEVVKAVVNILSAQQPKNVVLDPVMLAKNGSPLLQEETIASLKADLFPLVHLITPNIPEAEKLLNCKIETEAEMALAAETLAKQYGFNVLVKGGHRLSTKVSDVLYLLEGAKLHWFETTRIETKNTHGTGCTLSAAIASYLAQGLSYIEAIAKAKGYLTEAIAAGSTQQLGKGRGPVDHFYFI